MVAAMTACPVCLGDDLIPFVRRDRVPVTQNLIVATQAAAREITRGVLDMCCCARCGFAFNRSFDPSLPGYGEAYDNTQSHSRSFKAYMDELARVIIEERGVQNARIVEVGCGKGYFLHRLVDNTAGNTGWGFDPSYLGPESALGGRLHFEQRYYGPSCRSLRADVVVCRHVIEHVADPVALLATVRAALEGSPGARVFFETPSLAWILERLVIWDFFYEHCSLFTPASLTTAFQRAGFAITGVTTTFGGQYLWLEATLAEPSDSPSLDAGTIPALARRFGEEEQQWIGRWRDRVRSSQKLAIWGAGAKGVTFANLVDRGCELIDCVIDLNPHKQNHFVPGTGHPIVAPEAIGKRGVKRALLMNPNYRDENQALLHSLNLAIELEE